MPKFNRGLSDSFVAALNEAYETGGWWKKIIDDDQLFVAVRDEYLNVYYKGNSQIRLSLTNGTLKAKTHYKYLIKPSLEKNVSCLIETSDNMSFIPENSTGIFDRYLNHDLSDIESIKKASSAYSGVEKEGIQKIIGANDNIIDLEIALTKQALQDEDSHKDSTKRIDFAAIHNIGDMRYELVFFEAKDYSNKELRATGDTLPPVIKKQIPAYEKLLSQYKDDIRQSFKRVCQNQIDLLSKRSFNKSIADIAAGAELKISLKPRLVIFGFDDDQKQGKFFNHNIQKLIDNLGKDRVLMKGDPKNFVKGISYPI